MIEKNNDIAKKIFTFNIERVKMNDDVDDG
jgi:hypothetical protein